MSRDCSQLQCSLTHSVRRGDEKNEKKANIVRSLTIDPCSSMIPIAMLRARPRSIYYILVPCVAVLEVIRRTAFVSTNERLALFSFAQRATSSASQWPLAFSLPAVLVVRTPAGS